MILSTQGQESATRRHGGNMDMKSINTPSSTPLPVTTLDSEFGRSGYDQADIILAFTDYLNGPIPEKGQDVTNVRGFNAYLLERINAETYIESVKTIQDNFDSFSKIGFLDTPDGKPIDVNMYLTRLINSFKDKISSQIDDRVFYCDEAANTYLDAFYELAKQVVFAPMNYNLSNPAFRKSDFLRDLLSFAARSEHMPHVPMDKSVFPDKSVSPDKKVYLYSLFDPFIYDMVQRAVLCASKLRLRFAAERDRNGDCLSNLRCSIFLNSVQSSFRRFVSLNNKTYRIELNRHDSSLMATSYDDLSSIEETKPIRLFEKTAAYIRNNVMKVTSSTYCINVCIIGHTEMAKDGSESELGDLAAAIVNWYSGLSIDTADFHKPALCMSILNIINEYDGPKSNFEQTRIDFERRNGKHLVRCDIKKENYFNVFGLDTKKLAALINEHQILYVLDCPFLTMENLEIKQNGSLDAFCHMLSNRNRDYPPADTNLHTDFQFFYKHSAMQELDSQFNRIMSSTTQSAGEIVRVIKDQFLKNMEAVIAKYSDHPEQKKLYVFLSEKDGIDFSYIAGYPLTRHERYDGKNFTIISFSNHKSDTLRCNSNGIVHFQIRLWSVFKYISVSYAYLFFKEKIKSCFTESDCAIDYFGIYRNIVLDGEVNESLKTIHLEVRLCDGIEDYLNALGPSSRKDEIKQKLLRLAKETLKSLYCDAVFSDKQLYGNDAIRTAFMMNLYSSANDVNTMLFWHKYRMANQSGELKKFSVEFSEHDNIKLLPLRDDEFLMKDFLMDKKLYDALLQTLEFTTQFSIGMKAMLYSAKVVFAEQRIGQTILYNIKKACEQAGDVESKLYRNTCAALNEV